MSKPKSKVKKGSRAPKRQPKDGELADAALDKVAGGARVADAVATTSDMTELDKFDLQQRYQEYAQGVSTLSNVIKDAHDNQNQIVKNLKP
jgi:hypothetical protein